MTHIPAAAVSIVAIVALAWLEGTAVVHACDGAGFAAVVAAIATLGGFTLRTLMDTERA